MDFLQILKRLFRFRRYPRFSLDKGILVVIEPYAAAYKQVQVLDNIKRSQVQVLDISQGGCAFIYNGSKKDLEESGLLTLRFKDITCLQRIRFVSKSDVILSDSNNKEEQLRRRGVEFQWLGVLDRKKLKKFIKENAVDRA